MRVVVVIPPEPVVSLDEAKDRLRVLTSDDDALIEALIEAATAHIDGPRGWLGRALGLQTLEARLDGFGGGELALSNPPVVEVMSVKYLAAGTGIETTVAAGQYEVMGDRLAPVFGAAWPTPRWQREAVRVQYRAGYEIVPAPIRTAILLMVGDLYAFRETLVTGTIATVVPMSTTVDALLGPFRIY